MRKSIEVIYVAVFLLRFFSFNILNLRILLNKQNRCRWKHVCNVLCCVSYEHIIFILYLRCNIIWLNELFVNEYSYFYFDMSRSKFVYQNILNHSLKMMLYFYLLFQYLAIIHKSWVSRIGMHQIYKQNWEKTQSS